MRLSCTRKCNRLIAFQATFSTCAFQFRSAFVISPSNLAVLTTSTSFLSITTASSSTGLLENEIWSSLQLSGLSCSLFIWDHSITWLTILYALLVFPFGTTSDAVMSWKNFHKCGVFTSKSFIINTKNFVWGEKKYWQLKISYFLTCADIANRLLTRHSPLAPLGQVDEWTAKPSWFSIPVICRSFLEIWQLKH